MRKYFKIPLMMLIILSLLSITTACQNNTESLYLFKNSELNDVTFDENKVNIYLFYGDGCPYCEEEIVFLKTIDEKYHNLIKVYTFETWYNNSNKALLEEVATKMGDKVTGVPYTVIGNETISGFNKLTEIKIMGAIDEQLNQDYDVIKIIKESLWNLKNVTIF